MKPIYIAIDTPDLDRAKHLAKAVAPLAGGLKLGLEFFCHNGRAGVMELAETGLPIFLDLKLHDIPNTVAKAIQALSPLTPSILTVHAAGGRAMLEDAKAAAPSGTRVVVCSGKELAAVRRAWKDGFFVVPGIRPADAATGDQKRVMTPRAALDAGASILVIGRPVTAAEDPAAALRAIAGTL